MICCINAFILTLSSSSKVPRVKGVCLSLDGKVPVAQYILSSFLELGLFFF